MPYTPDPEDVNTPSDARAQGRSHAEIRALKNRINQLETTLESADQTLQGNVDSEAQTRLDEDNQLSQSISSVDDSLSQHVGDSTNPHGTTKAQVGLGNVPNTLFQNYSDYFDAQDETKVVADGIANAKSVGDLAHALIDYTDSAITERFKDHYPIGFILVVNKSVTNFDPNEDSRYNFGTWVRIEDKYLIGQNPGSNSVDQDVGSHNKTLTENNLPNHSHSANVHDPGHYHEYAASLRDAGVNSFGGKQVMDDSIRTYLTQDARTGISVSIGATGGGQQFDVRPRSKVVSMWERTA